MAHAPRTPGPRPRSALPISLDWAGRERGPASAPHCKVQRPAVEGEAFARLPQYASLPSLPGVPGALPSPGLPAYQSALPRAASPLQVLGREGSGARPGTRLGNLKPVKEELGFKKLGSQWELTLWP